MAERESGAGPRPRQAAVIPLRRGDPSGVQVCLIRRKGSSKWGIPKGFIDRGDSPQQAALTEAYEEAGLSGQLLGESIGTYEYKKWGRSLTVAVFLMDVREEHSSWKERRFRERRWLPMDAAFTRLEDHRVQPLLDRVRASKSILKSLASDR